MYVFLSLILLLLVHVEGCYIWGTDSGTCSTDTLDPLWRLANMPYCADAIQYPACIPTYQTLPPSREYPNGRWYNNTVITKDNWVRSSCNTHIRTQILAERGKAVATQNQDQSSSGKVRRRFYKKPDCQEAFRKLFCWLNFPRCDSRTDLTLPTCKSACENFFKSCGYEKGLWRCGQSKFFNGYEAESPTMVDGNATYLRDYFPGQPFRKNKFSPGGHQYAICTPAIDGSARRRSYHPLLMVLVALVTILLSTRFIGRYKE